MGFSLFKKRRKNNENSLKEWITLSEEQLISIKKAEENELFEELTKYISDNYEYRFDGYKKEEVEKICNETIINGQSIGLELADYLKVYIDLVLKFSPYLSFANDPFINEILNQKSFIPEEKLYEMEIYLENSYKPIQ